MPQITPEVETFARIKVLGVGGSGGNALNHMVTSKVRGVEFIVINSDAQDLHKSLAKKKIHIGKNLTKGLGTGMNAELGKRAVEETKEEVQEAIKGADMIFIAGGMGGGTCTGAAPIVARTAKELKTTGQLVEVIEKAVPASYRRQRLHFATKTFQALRIATNDELENLQAALRGAVDILTDGGRLVVISFHSLEDRIVKTFFQENPSLEPLTKKPVTPSDQEQTANPRSRSAKLRAAKKIHYEK